MSTSVVVRRAVSRLDVRAFSMALCGLHWNLIQDPRA